MHQGHRNPCLRCGRTGHNRRTCPQQSTTCPYCQADHHGKFCFHTSAPGGAPRDNLGRGAAEVVRRESQNTSAAPPPRALHAQSTPPQAQLPSPTEHRNGDTEHSAPAATDEHNSAAALANAYAAAVHGYPATIHGYPVNSSHAAADTRRDVCGALRSFNDTLPPAHLAARASRVESRVFVDSMATLWIVRDRRSLLRVTDPNPGFSVEALGGTVPVTAVGDVGLHLLTAEHKWRYYEVSGVILVPSATADLYSTQVMYAQHGVRHDFDDVCALRLPQRTTPGSHTVEGAADVPFDLVNGAYVLPVIYGPPPRGHRIHAHSVIAPTLALRGSAIVPSQSGVAAQSLLWQRLGFPGHSSWRHVLPVTTGHGLLPDTVLTTTLVARDEVMAGRTRAASFSRHTPEDRTLPPPGAVLYMDFAGPMIQSFHHRFTCVCGVIDAGSGYRRAFATHGMKSDDARSALEQFLADVTAKMALTVPLKPHVVVTDQGSGFTATHFADFLASAQVAHRLSCAYEPRQNSYAERMWGTCFSTARVLLASARLPPPYYTFALQTAAYLHNRLPQPSRGNLSPFFILARQPADLTFLRSFGCFARLYIPVPTRHGDKHLADRGTAGIYLGPSERSNGAVCMELHSRKLRVLPHVQCFEDQFPGVGGPRGRHDVPDPSASRDVSLPVPPSPSSSVQEGPVSIADRHKITDQHPHYNCSDNYGDNIRSPVPSQASTSSPGLYTSTPPSFNQHPSPPPSRVPTHAWGSPPGSATIQTNSSSSTPARRSRPRNHTTSSASSDAQPGSGINIETTDQVVHPRASDPSSRHFERQHPRRASRTGPYAHVALNHTYVDPVEARRPDTVRNFTLMALALAVVPAFAFYSCVSPISDLDGNPLDECTARPLAMPTVVQPTTDLGDVAIPRGYRQAVDSQHSQYWLDAINRELKGIIALNTWTPVPLKSVPRNTNLLRCHYIFTVKRKSDGSIEKFKCRLVADGNSQKHGVDFDRVFSTVVKASTIRLVLTIAAAEDLNLTNIDIRQAYLQAELKENIYMRPPPGVPKVDREGREVVLKLNRSLYGLKQAGREWNAVLSDFLRSYGFVQSSIDTCLFTCHRKRSFVWLLLYVDDGLVADNDPELRLDFINALSKRFPTDDRGELEWLLGVKITRDRAAKTISLSQKLYIQDLVGRHDLSVSHAKYYSTPLDERTKLDAKAMPAAGSSEAEHMAGKHDAYHAMVGSILWLANMTRPELAYAASQLAKFVSNPGRTHYDAAVRTLLYLSGSEDRAFVIRPSADLKLTICTDSNWDVRFSCCGGILHYGGAPFAWFAKTQRSVSLSSAEAEFFGAMLAAREGQFARELLVDLGRPPTGPTIIFTDSKSCVDLSIEAVAFKKTKHILRAAEYLRDLVLREVFTLKHIPGVDNPADVMTKALPRGTFLKVVDLIYSFKNRVSVPAVVDCR